MSNNPLYKANIRHVSDLKDMLNQSAKLFPNNNAFKIKIDGNYNGISYTQYKEDVDSLGTALINLGLKDSFISLIGENRYEWCTSYLGVTNGAGIIVPLDRELPLTEIENLLNRSQSKAIIFSSKHLKDIESIHERVPSVEYYINMDADDDYGNFLSYKKLLEKGKSLILDGDKSYINATIDREAMNMLIFTSGTTDLAKGVMLSHKNVTTDVMAITQCLYIDDKDSALSILPLHHTYECTAGFLVMIYNGCCMSFCDGLKHIPKNLKELKPSIVMMVPLILESIYRRINDTISKKPGGKFILRNALNFSNFTRRVLGIDLRKKIFKQVHETLGGRLRLVISGAAALSPHVARGFQDMGINVIQGYGLTECSPIVTVNRDELFKYDSIGLPLYGVEVKLHNVDENGMGELMVKGDIVMLGYYQNEDATNKVLKDGWFLTGDLGTVDSDGFFKITGRKKNVIVTKNGKNIFPEEVESYLNKSDFILESLVTGNEDEQTSEPIVTAQIVPDMDTIRTKFNTDISEEDLFKLIQNEVKKANKKMPLYKHVKSFTIRREEFAKTTSRKIKRYGQEIKSS